MIKEADFNTGQESSSGAVGSELQIHFDYVVQNDNTAYPPYNWILGKNILPTITRAENILGSFREITEVL